MTSTIDELEAVKYKGHTLRLFREQEVEGDVFYWVNIHTESGAPVYADHPLFSMDEAKEWLDDYIENGGILHKVMVAYTETTMGIVEVFAIDEDDAKEKAQQVIDDGGLDALDRQETSYSYVRITV